MADDKRHGRQVRPIARIAFTAGVCASLAANIAAAHPTAGARIVAAWLALALLLVVEMLARPSASAPAAPNAVPWQRPRRPVRKRGVDRRRNLLTTTLALRPRRNPDRQPPHPRVRVRVRRTRHHRAAAEDRLRAECQLRSERRNRQPREGGTREVRPAGTSAQPPLRPGAATPTQRVRIKRPTADTQAIIAQITAEDPQITRADLARRLGLSTRRLREVLAT